MFFFAVVFLFLGLVDNSPIPDLPTIDSCTNRQITITDRNIRKAIHFFRGCRNLGLTMGDLLPEEYMKNLGNILKTANYLFLRQTNISQPKLRMLEKELNDLYQEVIILSEKISLVSKTFKPRCTTTRKCSTTTTTPCPTTTPSPTTTPCPTTEARMNPTAYEWPEQEESTTLVDLLEYDYSRQDPSSSEDPRLGYVLFALVLMTFIICLWTCGIARRTYKLLKGFQLEDDAENVEK